jgi:two-component system chemotaxis response regulator CheB
MEKKPIEILCIGGSAGSFDVLMQIIPRIRTDIKFPIIIILHRKSNPATIISEVFKIRTDLKVCECEEKEVLLPGTIYFAPAGYHILIEKNKSISLDYSEKVNYSRPSIDVAFKSISDIFEEKTAAILLSGANADGSKGLFYVFNKNGTTIVQSPESAEVGYMPQQAINLFKPHHISNIPEMIDLINNL